MKIRGSLLASIAGLLLLATGVAACSPGTTAASPAKSIPVGEQFLVDEQGSVTIEATWEQAADGALVFEISMNTHSVDLDDLDLSELAVLRDGTGVIYKPLSWDAAPGGHHRRGKLVFPGPDGSSIVTGGSIDLVIRDIAGIPERTFHWDL